MDGTTVSVTPIFDPVVTVYREQEAYPILSFVADIGGILGLFIGFNFLMVWDWMINAMTSIHIKNYVSVVKAALTRKQS